MASYGAKRRSESAVDGDADQPRHNELHRTSGDLSRYKNHLKTLAQSGLGGEGLLEYNCKPLMEGR